MSTYIDEFRHQGLRTKMVNALRQKNRFEEPILQAIAKVPRHYFLDTALDHLAYLDDKALPIGSGQTISQPSTVALQTQLLQVQGGEKVLEIGTGSGYQAAVLCAMGCKVYSIERHKKLSDKAGKILKAMHYSPTLIFGDGFKGLPQFAPFDRIIITCGAEQLPEQLLDQLRIGGRMVIPLQKDGTLQMCSLDRTSNTEAKLSMHEPCSFVPFLPGVVI
ncbi:MAG: protein-L-isoaspartate(D-aspartate) O-methyltransferase [Bacteroidales bacterium]